jgi:hypothetical protein
MLNITIVGLHHPLQWKDVESKQLESCFLGHLERTPTIEMIAEEANNLPTTVGQRLAFRLNKPWANVDMDRHERECNGIIAELRSRPGGPLDDNSDGYKQYYMPQEDGIREEFWLNRIRNFRVTGVLLICGLMHLSTVAERFRKRGWLVDEVNVCELQWCKSKFGSMSIVEKNGQRWCECRPLS